MFANGKNVDKPKKVDWLIKIRMKGDLNAFPSQGASRGMGWGAKSGLGNPGVQALGAHSEQLE